MALFFEISRIASSEAPIVVCTIIVVVVALFELEVAEPFFARTGKKSILEKITILTIEYKRMKLIATVVANFFKYKTWSSFQVLER
jgi:hypothetical protein